jgi:hypothetical protein
MVAFRILGYQTLLQIVGKKGTAPGASMINIGYCPNVKLSRVWRKFVQNGGRGGGQVARTQAQGHRGRCTKQRVFWYHIHYESLTPTRGIQKGEVLLRGLGQSPSVPSCRPSPAFGSGWVRGGESSVRTPLVGLRPPSCSVQLHKAIPCPIRHPSAISCCPLAQFHLFRIDPVYIYPPTLRAQDKNAGSKNKSFKLAGIRQDFMLEA